MHSTPYDFPRPYPHIPATPKQLRVCFQEAWSQVVDDIELLQRAEEATKAGKYWPMSIPEQESIFRIKPYASHLYFLYSDHSKLVKIGKTTDPKQRIQCLRTQSPVPLQCLGIIRSHDYHERMLHDALASNRKHGEWFNLTEEILNLIEAAGDKGIRVIHEFIIKTLDTEKTLE